MYIPQPNYPYPQPVVYPGWYYIPPVWPIIQPTPVPYTPPTWPIVIC